ncbi:MAG: amino acid decarboxylase [Acidobacteria bacterium]|nr:amino acid decarboxylase [Acidobacteriota bacterium]
MSQEPRKPSPLGDMSPEEFRRHAHETVDWIADYFAGISTYEVLSRARPGEIRNSLPLGAPSEGEPMRAILDDLDRVILPGITHWNHPGFFAYFANTGSGPGVLGEMICAALNVNGMLWKTSPAATELEEVVLDWLRQMLGLPKEFFGVVQDTASVSTMCALAAAREAVPGLNVREGGLGGSLASAPKGVPPALRIYTSVEAHSSVEKAAITLGLGHAGVRKIPVDEQFRMRPDALARAIDEDLGTGWKPFCVVATVGTTSTTSIDPVPEIAGICVRHGLWLHVDAAYGGAAALLPEMNHLLAGCDRADSLVINPHKWLFVPMDFSALYCKKPEVLRRAFSLVPEYLQTAEDAAVHNLMDYGVSLGRRFRALKFWMVLRYFGREGLVSRIREHIRLARMFTVWVEEHPDFELMAPVTMALVCFRARPRGSEEKISDSKIGGGAAASDLDALNERLINAVNGTGEAYLSQTRIRDRVAIRLSIGNIRTTESHVHRVWELLLTKLDDLGSPRSGTSTGS